MCCFNDYISDEDIFLISDKLMIHSIKLMAMDLNNKAVVQQKKRREKWRSILRVFPKAKN